MFLGLNHVLQGDFCGGKARIETCCNRAPKRSLRVCRSGQEEDFVIVVEGHQPLGGPALFARQLPSVVEVDTRQEMFGLVGVVEAALLDHRDVGIQRHEDHRKDAHAISGRATFLGGVHFDALDAA